MRFKEYYLDEGWKEKLKGFIDKLKGVWDKVKTPVVNVVKDYFSKLKTKFLNVIQKSFGLGLKVISKIVSFADIEEEQKAEIQEALNKKDLLQAIKAMTQLNKKYKPSEEEIKEAKEKGIDIGEKIFNKTKTEGYDYNIDMILTEGFLDDVKKSMSNPNVLRATILLILLIALFFPLFAEGFTEVINGVEHVVKGMEFSAPAEPVGEYTRDFIIKMFTNSIKEQSILGSEVVDSASEFFKATTSTALKAGTTEVIEKILSVTAETAEGTKTLFQHFPLDATPAEMGEALKEFLKSNPEKAQEIISDLKLI